MVQIHNQKRQTRKQLVAYLTWLLMLTIVLLLLCGWLFGGFAARQYEFIDFYTCQNNESTEQVVIYSVPVERIYICGEIQADGIVSGSIHVYDDGDIIFQGWLSEKAGLFIYEIHYSKGFQPGVYTVNFYARKRVRAQTTFTVIKGETS